MWLEFISINFAKWCTVKQSSLNDFGQWKCCALLEKGLQIFSHYDADKAPWVYIIQYSAYSRFHIVIAVYSAYSSFHIVIAVYSAYSRLHIVIAVYSGVTVGFTLW
jgi:hypothetical protein